MLQHILLRAITITMKTINNLRVLQQRRFYVYRAIQSVQDKTHNAGLDALGCTLRASQKAVIHVVGVLAIFASLGTTLYANPKQNSAIITVASCKLSDSDKTVSVLKKGSNLQVIISSGTNMTIKLNDSFVENKDASRICFSEGFNYLSCSATSFLIQQQVCTRKLLIQESFTFNQRKPSKDFYLSQYQREEINKNATSKQAQTKVYTEKQMGLVEFQDVTRDYLIRLINK